MTQRAALIQPGTSPQQLPRVSLLHALGKALLTIPGAVVEFCRREAAACNLLMAPEMRELLPEGKASLRPVLAAGPQRRKVADLWISAIAKFPARQTANCKARLKHDQLRMVVKGRDQEMRREKLQVRENGLTTLRTRLATQIGKQTLKSQARLFVERPAAPSRETAAKSQRSKSLNLDLLVARPCTKRTARRLQQRKTGVAEYPVPSQAQRLTQNPIWGLVLGIALTPVQGKTASVTPSKAPEAEIHQETPR